MQLAEKQELIVAIGAFIADAIGKAVGPLVERIKALESDVHRLESETKNWEASTTEQFEAVATEINSTRGLTVGLVNVLDVKRMIDEAVIAVPLPKDGEPGKSVTIEDCRPVLAEALDEAVKQIIDQIPVPKDGEPGKSVRVEDVLPSLTVILHEEVKRMFSGLPIPKDGEPGKPGKNGIDAVSALIDKDGCLVFTLSDGTVKNVGLVVGKDGQPGKPGLDGVGFDDMTAEFDGERGLKLIWEKDGIVKELAINIPGVIDRGVFKEGTVYERGDAVSWGGSLWIAQINTTDKPGDSSKSWRLAVKKGRDGRDGVIKQMPDKPIVKV